MLENIYCFLALNFSEPKVYHSVHWGRKYGKKQLFDLIQSVKIYTYPPRAWKVSKNDYLFLLHLFPYDWYKICKFHNTNKRQLEKIYLFYGTKI